MIPLARLNVVAGHNGSGKSSLYRALRLLSDIAQGRAVAALASEGGLQSALWAGTETCSTRTRHDAISLRLGFATEDFSYAVDFGLPTPSGSAFTHDPEIKRECIWNGERFRPASLLIDRRNSFVRIRRPDGKWQPLAHQLATFDSVMTHCADVVTAPECLLLREKIRGWRFYEHFRADIKSPARLPQVGSRAPVLADGGANLASAVQTIIEIGDRTAFAEAIADAFAGATVSVRHEKGRFELEMHQKPVLRPLSTAELSDGTLRYLLLATALHTPRPPSIFVINEPETSLHPDLLPALGRLIVSIAARTQVLVITHSARLAASLEEAPDCRSFVLEKQLGETSILGGMSTPVCNWQWPTR